MADIKLFEIGNEVKEYKGENVALEKELQNIIEKNMDTFFGVTFLASEYKRMVDVWTVSELTKITAL